MDSTEQYQNLNPDEWQQARVIFDEALRLPMNERHAFVERACDGRSHLVIEMRSLLDACSDEEAASESVRNAASSENPEQRRRRQIGPYQLGRLLGRGGMGAVYLAHRSDGHFEQEVAIKLIDLPAITDIYSKQFKVERQILAGLAHPFIARLLDGGMSEDGELYLAMEYIEGVSILRYCDQNNLSLRARVLLFKAVCEAVQYAHQNLVIHRDLKPDNILVVPDGTPRLLDFGTAKIMSDASESTPSELTGLGLRSFTPQYASPEQVLEKPISTASDIYSLVVLLFQMLAGVPPYELKEFTTGEMLRVICEMQPPKPSSVAVCTEKPDADLDSIVLKALRKEPEERYQTVDQLASDLQAWLDGRPVMARRGTFRYRAGKFAMRNKLAPCAVSLVLLAIIGGAVGVLWQARAANLQRDRAEANAGAMRDLSNSFLSEIDQAVKQLPNSTSVRRLMVQRVAEQLDRVPRSDGVDRLTSIYLINAYIQLARLQGSPAEQSIGDGPGALQSIDKAMGVAEILESEYPRDREVARVSAQVLKTKSLLLYGVGKPDEGIATLKPAIKTLDEEIDTPKAVPRQIADAADASNLLAAELGDPETPSAGDYSSALIAYKRSTDLYFRSLAIDPGFVRARRGIAGNLGSIGHILIFTDPVRAIDEIHKSLATWDSLPITGKSDAESRLKIQFTKNLLGKALSRTRDYKSAISVYEETRKSMEQGVAWDADDSRALTFLVGILGDEAETDIDMLNPLLNPQERNIRRENVEQAKKLLTRSIALSGKLTSLDPNDPMQSAYLAYENVLLGTLEQNIGDRKNDDHMAAVSVASLRKLASRPDASSEVLYRAASVMTSVLPTRLRDSKLAVQYAERLAALSRRQNPNSLLLLAQAYLQDGQVAKADQTAREGVSRLAPQRPGTPAERCRVLLEYTLRSILKAQNIQAIRPR